MAKKTPAPKKKPAADRPTPAGQPTRSPAPDTPYIVADLRRLAVPIASLTPDPKNARRHDAADLKALAASLAEFGQRKPVVVNRKGGVIEAGHGLVEAAKLNGWSHVAAVFVEDDPSAHVGYALADNRTAELSSWNDALLAELLAEHGDANADLFDALLLADLLEEPADSAAGGRRANKSTSTATQVEVPEAWQIVVEVENEDRQRELYERLVAEGYDCRIVNL